MYDNILNKFCRTCGEPIIEIGIDYCCNCDPDRNIATVSTDASLPVVNTRFFSGPPIITEIVPPQEDCPRCLEIDDILLRVDDIFDIATQVAKRSNDPEMVEILKFLELLIEFNEEVE